MQIFRIKDFTTKQLDMKVIVILLSASQFLLPSFADCELISKSSQERGYNSEKLDLLKEMRINYRNLTESINIWGPHLRFQKRETTRDIYSDRHFNYTHDFFFKMDTHHNRLNFSDLYQMGVTAKLQSTIYSDLLIHHYNNFDELKQSGGPEVNQELCLDQLKYFIKRAKRINEDRLQKRKDVDFYRVLDSHGRRPSGLLVGSTVWLGYYDGCFEPNVLDERNEKINIRYCLLNLRFNKWTQHDNAAKLIAVKMGSCLPKSCDSRNYKNKYELVEQLAHVAVGSHDLNSMNMTGLYCLPDEQSTLSIWYHSPRAVITLACFALWILLQVYATYKYDKFSRRVGETKPINIISTSNTEEKAIQCKVAENEDARMKIYKILSIKVNIGKLFNITDKSSLMADSQQAKSGEQPDTKQIVDLSNLEGIKVISMIDVILGHVLMCSTMIMRNGRDMAYTTSISWFTANLTPAFAVNSFFCITGILTSYLIFKTKQIENMTRKPVMWIGLIAYRYLRTLPLYLIVVLYLKNVAKFTGSGPLWDYGTSSIGQRRMCEEESILWTLLFGSNFMNPLEHCIPSAWYLSNDFQFFLVTPIFLTALYKNHKFGIKLLIASILAGYVAGIASIYMTDFDNLKPIANFMPHGLKTYITFFEHNYTHPQYRIPAYLIGLLAGFMLYKHEQDKISFESSKKGYGKRPPLTSQEQSASMITTINERDESDDTDGDNAVQMRTAPDWPDSFKRFGLSLSALLVFTCCITPLIATRLPFNKFFARLLTSFIMPSYHVLFSLAVAIYILLTSTGYGNKTITGLLASPLWKPFARLSLCVVLINIEVINYFVQSSRSTQRINDQVLFVLNSSCILMTYVVAVVVCVLFEAPLRGISNLGLSHIMSKLTSRPSKSKSK